MHPAWLEESARIAFCVQIDKWDGHKLVSKGKSESAADAARRSDVAAEQVAPGRISFLDALRWLREADPGEALPDLLVNPLRPGRSQPRVIKDRNDSYPRMTRPRAFLKQHPGYYGK